MEKIEVLEIIASRDYYSEYEAGNQSMTVAELIKKLEEYNPDAKVVLSHDKGYTYGYLDSWRIEDETKCITEEE